jgi:serine/threonine protein kinase
VIIIIIIKYINYYNKILFYASPHNFLLLSSQKKKNDGDQEHKGKKGTRSCLELQVNNVLNYSVVFFFTHSLSFAQEIMFANNGKKRLCSAHYTLVSVLGEGQYGMVTKARSKSDGKLVAIKKIKMAWAEKYNEGFPITTLREINFLLSELMLPKEERHPNIVGLVDIVHADAEYDGEDGADWKDAICMVFEYLDYDFGALLANPTTLITIDNVKCYMRQILNALVFAENKRVMHRDLKPANLLLSKDSHCIKLADWGMARKELSEAKGRTTINVRVVDGCFWMTRGPWADFCSVRKLPLRLLSPAVYFFDQSHESNKGYPLFVSRWVQGTEDYTYGLFRENVPCGEPGAGFAFQIDTATPQFLKYYCPNQSGIGGRITVKNLYSVNVVSLCWRAPELLLQEKLQKSNRPGIYGTKIDLWSAGCIFAEMLRRGKPILPGMSEVDQLIKILKLCGTPEQGPGWVQYLDANLTEETKERVLNLPKYPRCVRETFKKYPDDMVDLLDKILRINPSERISLQEARDHPFFTNGDNSQPVCPNCLGRHAELEAFVMDSTHESDLKKQRQKESAARRKRMEQQREEAELKRAAEEKKKKALKEQQALLDLRDATVISTTSEFSGYDGVGEAPKPHQSFEQGRGRGNMLRSSRKGAIPPFFQ